MALMEVGGIERPEKDKWADRRIDVWSSEQGSHVAGEGHHTVRTKTCMVLASVHDQAHS